MPTPERTIEQAIIRGVESDLKSLKDKWLALHPEQTDFLENLFKYTEGGFWDGTC